MIIRNVLNTDLPAIHTLYADEVLNGVSSWEEIPPSPGEMQARCTAIVESGFPYLVAISDTTLVGYAYASSYRPRSGYRFTVENSVYVSAGARGTGIGRKLLLELINRCEEKGIRQMVAVIGDSANQASIQFHARLGFTHAGTIKSIGYKFGRWMDSVIMQKPLGDGDHVTPDSSS